MNKTNPLEEQLRSWIPRPPSERVKANLFAPEQRRETELIPSVWKWLVPTTICLLAAFVLMGKKAGFLERQNRFLVASIAPISCNSNLAKGFWTNSTFSYEKQDANLEWNIWPHATFEWTNRALSPSSMHSLSFEKTNLLMR